MFAPVQVTPVSTERLTEQMLAFMTFLSKSTDEGVFELAREYELTLSQLRAVFAIDHAEAPLALGELAVQVGLSVAATGRMVDVLVRHGLVARREDELDRRIKRHTVTADGEAFIARIHSSRRSGVEGVIALLDDRAREQLSHALNLMPASCGCGPDTSPGAS
jgi:DNA-binding MarR family transcriptional regulator